LGDKPEVKTIIKADFLMTNVLRAQDLWIKSFAEKMLKFTPNL
jgi:hypothetical protein